VDLPLPEPGPWPIERLDDLIAECEATDSPLVAYRGPIRWVQAFEPVRLEGKRRPVSLRPRGVYLISGGLGKVGLCLADYLARAVGARLVLVGRSPLPERAEWDQWLATHDERDVVSRRIRGVRDLESHGAEVWIASADVASPREMAAVVSQAVTRFGDVHGVIHAAGVTHGASFRPMAEIGLAECDEQFRPKVLGLYALEKALEGRSLDFWLLTSSLSTVLGGIGMGPYAAANAFMDGFAHQRGRGATGRWLSVDWEGWQFETAASSGMGAGVARLAMTAAEGVAALERILAAGVGRVVVSTGDLQARIEQWVTPKAPSRDLAPTGEGRHPRPALASPYVAPRGEVEQAVAEVWQELFGFKRVGVDDSFFDLGGDSLLAMQVVNRLRQTFHVPLKLQALFEAPTVAELARLMVDSEPRPGLASEIARLARSLESLSDVEVERMLQEQKASGGAA
jgi:NAD(P)-dependent dehydrogenase (short-subunit alcohol dehydrogenase family)/acyl carrier protein